VCEGCLQSFSAVPSRCFRCCEATSEYRTCKSCRKQTSIKAAWVAVPDHEAPRELLYKLKFLRAKQASQGMVRLMDTALGITDEMIVVPVPTARKRKRQRGYDQADLLASGIARSRQWKVQRLLLRISSERQTGASKRLRHEQAKSFFLSKSSNSSLPLLLVDDVLTTGATLDAAAKAIRAVCKNDIYALLYMQKT
jgi:ComF family protein